MSAEVVPCRSVAALWSAALSENPTRELLVDGRDGSEFTVAELDDLSRRAVGLLREWGLKAGDRLVVVAVAEIEAVVVLAGALRLGVAAVIVHPDAPHARIHEVVKAASAGHVLLATADPELRGASALDDPAFTEALLGRAAALAPPPVDPDEDAAVLFSSGSTGPARGVRLSLRALVDGMDRASRPLPPRPGQRDGVPSRLHTITGYRFTLLAPLLYRTTTIWLAPVPSPSVMLAEAEANRVDALHVGPGFVRAWVQGGRTERFPGLRRVLAGGGGLPIEERMVFARTLGVPLAHTYGSTETAGTIAATVAWPDGRGEAGMGVPYLRTRIVDEEGRPIMAEGRIQVAPDAPSSGYLGGAPVVVDGWVDTGDLGWLDAGGSLFVRGRAARTYVSPAGMKVQLEELEEEIRRGLGREAVVTPVEAPGWGSQLGVLVEGEGLGPLWIEQARAQLRVVLPEFAVPTLWRCAPSLPHLPSGKPDVGAVRRMFEESP